MPAVLLLAGSVSPRFAAPTLDLSQAVIVVRPGELPNAELAAVTALMEEFKSLTGIRLTTSTEWPAKKTVIAITSERKVPGWGIELPVRDGANLPET